MTFREHAITPGLARRISRRLTPHLARREMPFKLERPLVSISFDDFPQSVMENALPLLDQNDWKATFYVAAGLAGTTNHLGRHFDYDDIKTLVEKGHEIGCHSYSHINILETSERAIKQEIEDNERALKHLNVPPLKSFAYPYGETNIKRKRFLERNFAAMRGIVPGIHYNKVDLNQIKSMQIYNGPDTNRVIKAIKGLRDRPGWLTLFTHDVRENPSAFGCTPNDFSTVLQVIKDIGADVIPIHQAIGFLQKNNNAAIALNRVLRDNGDSA